MMYGSGRWRQQNKSAVVPVFQVSSIASGCWIAPGFSPGLVLWAPYTARSGDTPSYGHRE